MKKFNRKRVTGLLISWAAYAAILWWLSYRELHTCVFGILLLSSITTLFCLYLAWRPIKNISMAIIAGLILLGAPDRASAQTNGNESPFLEECGVALVIIGIGIVICIPLVKICKRCLPTTQPPPQPPVTNTPPVIVTNAPPKKHVTLNLSDNSFSVWDVSSMTLSNTDSGGLAYTVWIQGTIQSSTNLTAWKTECSMDAWVSARELVTVFRDDHGSLISTNRSSLFGGTNTVIVPAINDNADMKFFRIVQASP